MNARRAGVALALVVVGGGFAPIARVRTSTVVDRYENGQVRRDVQSQDGQLDGVVRGWYEDGSPMYVYHYRNGVTDGVQEQWFRSGQRYTLFNHHEGHEVGQQRMWNADGSIRSNYVIRDGKRFGLLGAMGCTGSGTPIGAAMP
jgi:antitoxin component YwqK of YwqJK toxin-antitoxin module